RQVGVVGQVRQADLLLAVHLRVGQECCELGSGQPLPHGASFRVGLVGGQVLQPAFEDLGAFQLTHVAAVDVPHARRLLAYGCQHRVLRVVAGLSEPGDVLGHVHEQLVPVRLGEVARLNFAVQHDLDVDFVVGGVHPGRVVDEVGVDPTSQAGELDTGGLGHTQVAALTHDLGTQLGRADTHLVVGLVTDLGVGLRGGLDVGSDTAVPHQVHRGAQDPADELVRAQLRDFVLDTEHFTYLRGHRYRLGGARVHATTLGDQFLVVVLPGAAGQVVQAITLGPGGLRVRVGVHEDGTVV